MRKKKEPNILDEFSFDKAYDYEHGFYLTSSPVRLSKLITHYELYKIAHHVPGEIVDCGVFKGTSFLQWCTFRNLLENEFARKIIGFDTFGQFPLAIRADDIKARAKFVQLAGEKSISKSELQLVCEHKGFSNIELVEGDIIKLVPKYVEERPELRIALLHIDTDLYEPSRTVLEYLYPLVVRGGVIVFDDYGTFPGGTAAIDEFLLSTQLHLERFSFSHWIPSYLKKP